MYTYQLGHNSSSCRHRASNRGKHSTTTPVSRSYIVHMYMYIHVHVHVIVVSCFLQCMRYVLRESCMYFRGRSPGKYIQHEGSTIPCTVKTMRQLTCTDRPYRATARLASAPEYSTYVHCVLYASCRASSTVR